MKFEPIVSQYEIHICNFKREGEECCFDRGAKDLTDELKKWAKEETKKQVKVFRAGCLGKCSEGIAIACYPEKKMLLEVKQSDSVEIQSYFKNQLK